MYNTLAKLAFTVTVSLLTPHVTDIPNVGKKKHAQFFKLDRTALSMYCSTFNKPSAELCLL